MLSWGFIAIVLVVIFVFLLVTVGESLVKLTANQSGVDTNEYSVIPGSWRSVFGRGKSKPAYVPEDEKMIHLTKGFDISLLGAAEHQDGDEIARVKSSTYALKPKDFIGMIPIPKLTVKVGDTVKAGDPVYFDKYRPEITYSAPVSGEVIEVRRAEKRSIAEIVILADQGDMQYRDYDVPNLETATREQLMSFLLESGVWPSIRQRPYDIVADHKQTPKSIFVTTFDSAPLAPDLNLAVAGKAAEFQKGLDTLAKLTEGKVHVALDARSDNSAPSEAFSGITGVEKVWFSGQHPAGNVGVHMHHLDPVNPGETVWHMDVHGVLLLGSLMLHGKFDTERVIAVTGAPLAPRYVRAHQGVNLAALIGAELDTTKEVEDYVWVEKKDASGNAVKDKKGKSVMVKEKQTVQKQALRILSGDVLTGNPVKADGFLGFYDDQVTALKEGDYYELFGWVVPQTGHPTVSRTFPGGFFPEAQYEADTNTNGEKRAFVMSGQYESVLPMDIYPQHLLRAIMANDFERMEGLGLLELGEEDVALCEYVCTSKQPVQKLLREGLEMMREQS